MTIGDNLLALQDLDLKMDRQRAELADVLKLTELSRKRAAYKKLKVEETKLIAQRKDLEFELEDLERSTVETEKKVTIAQHDAHVLKDYRAVQDLEVELSLLAKQLDKLAFDRDAKRKQIAQAREREDYIVEYVAKFERSLLADAQKVRDDAQELKATLGDLEAQRARIAARIDADVLARYEDARAAHGGMGVERLEGSVPSACRMALTESSLADLSRAGEIATCPYCHRILVMEGIGHDA